MTINECAATLGISRDLAYDLARRGELPGALHLGRRWVVSRRRLLEVLGAEDSHANNGDSLSAVNGSDTSKFVVRKVYGLVTAGSPPDRDALVLGAPLLLTD